MAYQLKAAIARTKALDALWETVDLSSMDINLIFRTYSKVYLTLTNTAFPDDVYLELGSVRDRIGVYTGYKSIPQWLQSLGNASLPTQPVLPQFRQRPARYSDAWDAGYHIRPVDRTRHPDAEIPDGAKDDLLLTRGDVDFLTWWRFCMVTVNGYFHRVGGSDHGMYVVDGGRTGRLGNNNHVGIYSFKDVGTLEYIPITQDMVHKVHPDQKYANSAHIRIPKSVEGKTVLLVLGGYLHVLDSTYRQIGPQLLRIDFNNYALPERIYQSLENGINLESLQLETSPNNPLQFSVEDLYSDRALLAYMCLPQSFLLVVNTDQFYVRKYELEKCELPGRWITPIPMQRLPMCGPLGKFIDYRAIPEWGKMVLAADHERDYRYNFNTHGWQAGTSVDPTRSTNWPWEFARAHLLEIGRLG